MSFLRIMVVCILVAAFSKNESYAQAIPPVLEPSERTQIRLTKEEFQYIAQQKPIKIAVDPNWAPIESINQKTGEYTGIVSDLIRRISEISGLRFQVTPTKTWEETLQRFRDNEIGMIPAISRTAEREAQMHFSNPALSLSNAIIMRTSAPFIGGLSDLKGKRIGVKKGNSLHQYLEKNHPELKLVLLGDTLEGIDQLAKKKIDAYADTLEVIGYLINQRGLYNLKLALRLPVKRELFIGLQKELDIAVLSIINKSLNLIDEKERRAIQQKWISLNVEERVNYDILWKLSLFGILIILIIVYWNRRLAIYNRDVQKANAALAETQRIAGLGSWDYFPRTRKLKWSEEVYRIAGRDVQAKPPTFNEYFNSIHKEDRKKYRDSIKKALAGNPYEVELRHIMPDGSYNYTLTRAKPVFEDGKVISVQGTVLDLTKLRQVELALQDEMAQRLKYEESLNKAKLEAENANRSKSEFLANMSHEIRTPLNAVIGFSELLEKTEVTEKQKGYLKSIRSGGKTLLSIINDILDLSKIESGKLVIHPEPSIIQSVIGEICQIFEPETQKKGLSLRLAIADDMPSCLMLDESRIRQVLFNLIGNAIKFTDHGSIDVSVGCQPNHNVPRTFDLEMEIMDTGVGIPVDQQQKVFEYFEQQDGQSNRKYGGTGLGLTISARLVEKMGGEISLQSTPGVGSTFTVKIRGLTQKDIDTQNSLCKELSMQSLVHFDKATLLVVDDIESNRNLVSSALEDSDIKIIEATDGSQAVLMSESDSPDLILMDLRMPVMGGIEAAEKIKANPITANIPIVAVTASTDLSFKNNASEKFDGYLVKPFTNKQLVDELKRFMPHQIEKGNMPPDTRLKASRISLTIETKSILNDRVAHLWRKATQTGGFDDLNAFAVAVGTVAAEYQNQALIGYAETFRKSVDEFDIESIEQQLQSFDELIS